MKFKKTVLVVASFCLIICILAGCGAKINTELKITENFSGQRKIDVIIQNDDLNDKVTGGIDALKSVADSKIPEEMTCSLTGVEGGSCLTFTIDFKDIDDYRNKVAAIISSGSNEELVPEITYENLNTVFKKGIKLNENFTSFDLLQWYFDAVKEANIVTYESSSDWYEMGDSNVIIDEIEYDSSSKLAIDEQELCCLDRIDVKTVLNIDGTFTRSFEFSAYDSTVEELSEKGCNLGSYISDLASEDDVYSEIMEDGLNKYIITVESADVQQLIEKTDRILQTSNDFSLEIELDKENIGNANVKIKEKLDGSFYLDYDYNSPLHSTIELYDNCSLIETDEIEATVEDDVIEYSPSSISDYNFDLKWKISFSSIEILSKIKDKNKATIEFIFTSEENLQEELKKSAIQALKKCCGEDVSFKEDGDVAVISFSGTIDELNDEINAFIQSNDSQKIEGKSYFNIDFSKSETTNNFTNAFTGNIVYDLSPIIGNTRVLFNDVDGLFADYYYQGNFNIDKDENKTVSSNGEVSFALVKLSLLSSVLFIVSCLLLIFGIILIIVKRKEIVGIILIAKEKKNRIAETNSLKNTAVADISKDNLEAVSVCAASETNTNSEIEQEEDLL